MCLLHRYVCQCCHMVYQRAPHLRRYNLLCAAQYLPVAFPALKAPPKAHHGCGEAILPTLPCRTTLTCQPQGWCTFCLVECRYSDEPLCHALPNEEVPFVLEGIRWLVRFAYEEPRWEEREEPRPYVVRELFRHQYYKKEQVRQALRFQALLHRRMLDQLLVSVGALEFLPEIECAD